jgi:peptidyl-tRNA hydrolase
LRDFSDENIKDLNEVLTLQALESRRQMNASEDITLDIDSAANEQSGKKIEGVAWNYKNQWCLDSLVVYDELGFCYGMQLRAGNTFSSQGSEAMLRDILKTMPEAQRRRVTVRADSAFCSEDFIRMCLLMGVKFSITAHGNMGWEKEVNDLTFKPL